MRAGRERRLAHGEILFYEGDASDCAYIVESGALDITTQLGEQTITLATLHAGDIVGEMGIIDSAPRTATASANGDTVLIVITRDSLTDRLSGVDPIILFIVKTLLERYRSGLDSVRGIKTPSEEHQSLTANTIGKIRLEASLKEALENDQLELRYQPMLDISTGTIAGFEALARWKHPVRGAISPDEFIALAEETSLIVPVGQYICEKACADLTEICKASERQGSTPDLFMSINVSVRQISNHDFINTVFDMTERFNINRRQIALEITETMALDVDILSPWVEHAQSMGFKISIDDFGTGHSGLGLLARLKPNKIKIDKLFIKNLENDSRVQDLLAAMVTMLKSLNYDIVVEGVEKQFELDFIGKLGCHYAQGYLVGKPLTKTEATALVGAKLA